MLGLALGLRTQVSNSARHAKRHSIYMWTYYHLSIFGSESMPNFCAIEDNIRLSITILSRAENFPATSLQLNAMIVATGRVYSC